MTFEISTNGAKKLITNQTYNKFPFENKDYVEFAVDLNSIGDPKKLYFLTYITGSYVDYSGNYCNVVDTTNWIQVPPPEFHIFISPNSFFMRPGEKKDIPILISGNIDQQSNVSLKIDRLDIANANLTLLSTNTVVSSISNGSSILHLEISDIESKNSNYYYIPISAKIFFPTKIPIRNDIIDNKAIESIEEYSAIGLTILPSLTPLEKLEELLKTVRPIGELWQIFAAIGGVFITTVFYFYRKNKSNNKEKDEEQNDVKKDNMTDSGIS